MSLIETILSRCHPEPNSGCWLWIFVVNPVTGYAYAPLGRRGKRVLAHRMSYEAFKGPIAPGLQIDHRCKTRSCVNPDHLEAVTQQENIRRQRHVAHNAAKTNCVKGHPLHGDNLYLRPTGGRACLTCRRAASLRHRSSPAELRNVAD